MCMTATSSCRIGASVHPCIRPRFLFHRPGQTLGWYSSPARPWSSLSNGLPQVISLAEAAASQFGYGPVRRLDVDCCAWSWPQDHGHAAGAEAWSAVSFAQTCLHPRAVKAEQYSMWSAPSGPLQLDALPRLSSVHVLATQSKPVQSRPCSLPAFSISAAEKCGTLMGVDTRPCRLHSAASDVSAAPLIAHGEESSRVALPV